MQSLTSDVTVPYLTFADLPNLRYASRAIAAVTTLDNLPASYWKTRFYIDHPHAAPVHPGEATDWRALCFSMPPLFSSQWGRNCSEMLHRCRFWDSLIISREPEGIPVQDNDVVDAMAD